MRSVLAFALAGLLVCAGCGATSRDSGRRSVVAAFYPLAFAAERIGGEAVDVRNLTPPGAEPHDVELSPREVGAIQRADVVLYLSHGFQPSVEDAVRDAHGTKLDALAGLDLRGESAGEDGTVDAHVWLDPPRFARVV